MTFWKVVPGMEIWLVSGWPTVTGEDADADEQDEPDGQRAPRVGGAPAAEAVQEGGHGGLLEDGEGGQEVRAATVARWGSRPVRTWPIAAVKQSRSEAVRSRRGCRGAGIRRGGRAQPDPERRLGGPDQAGGEGGDVDVGGVGAQAPAQPALEPVEPRVQLDEDQAAGVGGGLAGGGEHADPLEEVDVARVGDHGERAVEHVLVDRAGLEARPDRGEELGDAGGEHRLDRGEVVEEGAARDPGPVGDRLGREALEAGVAHQRVGGVG